MTVFWRKSHLTAAEQALLNACLQAHSESVHRDNISTVVLKNAAIGSMSYTSALVAALSSIGGIHAPLIQTVFALSESMEHLKRVITEGGKIPGWGSSFEKEGIDPIWQPVADILRSEFPLMWEKIDSITMELQRNGKSVWPNASVFTAATGLMLEIPPQIIAWLFIYGRLVGWTTTYFNTIAAELSPQKVEA